MFSFAYKYLLTLLLLVPALLVLYLRARHSRISKLNKFGRPSIVASLMPDASKYKAKH